MSNPGEFVRSILFFYFAQQPPVGQGLLIHNISRSKQRHTTIVRTSLDDWSVRRRNLYLKTHKINNRHPCHRLDSIPQFQRAFGRKRMPSTRGHWDVILIWILLSINYS